MALDDYLEPEIGVAVAATALLASPRLRKMLRRGLVYGMAGVMVAGDTASSMARGMGRGMKQANDEAAQMAQDGEDEETPAIIVVTDGVEVEEEAPRSRRRRTAKENADG